VPPVTFVVNAVMGVARHWAMLKGLVGGSGSAPSGGVPLPPTSPLPVPGALLPGLPLQQEGRRLHDRTRQQQDLEVRPRRACARSGAQSLAAAPPTTPSPASRAWLRTITPHPHPCPMDPY
jgi:hypothetical protein